MELEIVLLFSSQNQNWLRTLEEVFGIASHTYSRTMGKELS